MSKSFTSKIRQATLVLAVAAISSLYASQSFAYTAEQERMCTGDAFKFCSSEIPNISAITACMYKHKAELSAGCRAVMDKPVVDKVANK
jgi:hypothetical protein